MMSGKPALPLLALVAVGAVALAAAAQTPGPFATPPVDEATRPLSADELRIARDVPDEGTPSPARHYPVSNEWRHDLLYPYLDNLGGAYVGVGSDQSYTMAAAARSQLLWLIDYDPMIPLVHELYGALIVATDRPEALVARFSEESARDTAQLLETALADNPRRASILHLFRRHRPWFARYLRRALRPRAGRQSTWLSRPGFYDHVRALFRAGRVVARNGDVTGSRTMQAVAAAARRLNLPVRVLYFSNAEQFFPYRPSFAANVAALPIDERSVVVRTTRRRQLRVPPGCDWHYVVEELPDFVERLRAGYRRASQIDHDMITQSRDPAWPVGLSLVTRATPRRSLRVSER